MSRRERQKRRRRSRSHPVTKVMLVGAVLAVCGIALGAAAAVGWVVAVADNGPNLTELKARTPHPLTQIFAADGSSLGYVHSDTVYNPVPASKVPKLLREATIAIEDRRFYQHGALDYQGILRAGVKDLFSGRDSLQGASTLTMQLVDNKYMPPKIAANHNLKYKIIQAKLAEQLENKRTKSWILDNYLSDVPYGTVGGQTAIGVGAAAQVFFGKPVWKLSLPELAMIAGLPQAPSQYNPFLHPKLARQRRADVLRAMAASHYITLAQAASAMRKPLGVHATTRYTARRQPYLFDYVVHQLIQRFGANTVANGGLKVYTTIDPKRQVQAEQALLSHEGGPGQPAAALVSIDPSNGHIVTMATTSRYGTGPGETTFDYTWQGHRQTGSAFKVFSLMTLIHDYDGDPNKTYYTSKLLPAGWLPGYPTYSVHTAELSYQGTISITRATTDSDNTVFAQLAQDLTLPKVSATAHAMGITSKLTDFPSEALGAVSVSPLEMADAYATIASGGVHHPPSAITKVVFPDGSVVNMGSSPGNRVFSEGESYAATQVLKTVIQSGTGTAANYGCPAAGKTGTTSSFTDAYFDGYTPKLATAVWVGYPNETESMANGFGGTLAAPIWHDFMSAASDGYCGDFAVPAVLWHGTQFVGSFSAARAPSPSSSLGSSGSQAAPSSGGTGISPGGNPQNNPTLFAQPPQAPGSNGGGNGNGGGGGHGHGGGGKTGGAGTGKH
ncbi:MAG: transglycosylase domain-containing protein [Solirubrobacteraceae bacterium]